MRVSDRKAFYPVRCWAENCTTDQPWHTHVRAGGFLRRDPAEDDYLSPSTAPTGRTLGSSLQSMYAGQTGMFEEHDI